MCICIAITDEAWGRLKWTCLDEVNGMNDESIDLIVATYEISIPLPSTSRFGTDFKVTSKTGTEAGVVKKVTPTPPADPDPKSSPPDISVKFLPPPNHNLRPLAF